METLDSSASALSEALGDYLSWAGDAAWRCAEWLARRCHYPSSFSSSSSSSYSSSHADSQNNLLVAAAPCLVAVLSIGTAVLLTAGLGSRWRRRRRRREQPASAPHASSSSSACPAESRARPANKKRLRDVVAARMANACLEKFFGDDESVRKGLLRCWLRGINKKVKEEEEVGGASLEFVDVPAISTPVLKNVVAKWPDQGQPEVRGNLNIPALHFAVLARRGERRASHFLIVDDFSVDLTARLLKEEEGEGEETVSISSKHSREPFFRLVSPDDGGNDDDDGGGGGDNGIFHGSSSAVRQASVHIPLSSCLGLPPRHPPPPSSSSSPPELALTVTNLGVTFDRPQGHVFLLLRLGDHQKEEETQEAQTWLAQVSSDGREFEWDRGVHFKLSESTLTHTLSVECFRELDRRLLGRFCTRVRVPEAANLQDFVSPLSDSTAAGAQAELRIRVHLHGGRLGKRDAGREKGALLRRMNSNVSQQHAQRQQQQQQQKQQQQQQNFDSSSYLCLRSSDGNEGKYAVPDTVLWHLRQKRAMATNGGGRAGAGVAAVAEGKQTARSVLTISSVSRIERESRPKVSSENATETRNNVRLSICSVGRSVVVDCSGRHSRRFSTTSASSSAGDGGDSDVSTCSDCSMEVEADLSGWKGRVADSWGEGVDGGLEPPPPPAISVEDDAAPSNSNNRHLSLPSNSEGASGSGSNDGGGGRGGLLLLGGLKRSDGLRGSVLVLETADGALHLAEEMGTAERKRMLSMRKRWSRIRRRNKEEERAAIKLHVAKGHAFIAKHVKGGTRCTVCACLLLPLPGRQAYVCRDCGAVAHKKCHADVGGECPHSSFAQTN